MNSDARASLSAPQRITLGVRPGQAPSPLPPVRIFLGSEPRQHRAERIFVWSVERVRDPSRVYEIHRMYELPGFRRALWTTGFTNYRFAIPHFAGGAGRAIYNDTDQIYLDDPGKLFDLDLGEHGYLAVAPDDTSVMLLDAGRMAAVWSLRDAQRLHKRQLVRRAARTPGLFGPLDGRWNDRDDEFPDDRTGVLHFTTLATQPWRPFPEQFVYEAHPREPLWFELERSADAAGFQVFTRERPSAAYRAAGFGSATPPLAEAPESDVPWLLDERARAGGECVHEVIPVRRTRPSPRALGAPSTAVHSEAWWVERFEAAARRHPQLHFTLELDRGARGRWFHELGRHLGERAPRVWVLADDRPGAAGQATALAGALGWPAERKRIAHTPWAALHNRLLGASLRGVDRARSSPLEPPWPDLVISAGRRNAPVALWLWEQSRGRARLVQLGRKSGDAANLFDLSVSPAYVHLPAHPRRIATRAPLCRVPEADLAEAGERFKERLGAGRSPRVALLVGGSSGQYRLDASLAGRIGRDVRAAVEARGGSVLATTSRRTGEAATRALRAALGDDAYLFEWRDDAPGNPYLALLALADWFVVTGDSESMLAEAASLGRPVAIYPLPERRSFAWLSRPRRWVETRGSARPPGPRGTPRPQRGLEYLCARLIDRGWVRTVRDLSDFHGELCARGAAAPFGAELAPGNARAADDLELVAARVRERMGAR